MSRRYRLDIKIKALNLLEEHDGDLHLVKDALEIPVNTLRNWRVRELELRRQFYNRQQHHFYNVKFQLLANMLERCQTIMARLNDSALEKASPSQLAYTLTALLSHAVKLEEAFDELEKEDQMDEAPKGIRYIDNGGFEDSPRWAAEDPEPPRAVQGGRLREALGQVGIGSNSNPEGGSRQEQALLVDSAHVPDGESDLA